MLAALYDAHRLRLVRLAMLLIGDLHTAEDVVQEAFAKTPVRRRALADPNQALASLQAGVVKGSRSRLGDAPAESGILSAVRQLAARQREVLVLRYWADLSDPEIGAMLRMSPVALHSTATKALDALRHPGESALASAFEAAADLVTARDLRPLGIPERPRRRVRPLVALAAVAAAVAVLVPVLDGPDDSHRTPTPRHASSGPTTPGGESPGPSLDQLRDVRVAASTRLDVNGDGPVDSVRQLVGTGPDGKAVAVLDVELSSGIDSSVVLRRVAAEDLPGQLSAYDFDGDKRQELVLSTGSKGPTPARVSVFGLRGRGARLTELRQQPGAVLQVSADDKSMTADYYFDDDGLHSWRRLKAMGGQSYEVTVLSWWLFGDELLYDDEGRKCFELSTPSVQLAEDGNVLREKPPKCTVRSMVWSGGGTVADVTHADVDGDGRQDEVELVMLPDVKSPVWLRLTLATGETRAVETSYSEAPKPSLSRVLDLNRDGRDEVLTEQDRSYEQLMVYTWYDGELVFAQYGLGDPTNDRGVDAGIRMSDYYVDREGLHSWVRRFAGDRPLDRVDLWTVGLAGRMFVFSGKRTGCLALHAPLEEQPRPC